MGGKSQTTTQNQTQTQTPAGLAQLNDIWSRVQNAASTPFSPYTAPTVADLSATQRAGIGNINAAYGSAQPYFDEAAGYARAGAAPIDYAAIQRYQSPYTQQVVDATRADFNRQNEVQDNLLRGNLASRGALGGNRAGIARAELASNQRRQQDPIIANLYSSGWDKALGAAQGDRAAAAQGAYTFGALAPSVQNALLSGAQAQIGAGGLEYGVDQARLTAAYNEALRAQAFPYQQAGFLASAGLPAVTSMGGTTTGQATETKPGPNIFSQIAGLGIAGLGAAGGIPGISSLFGSPGASTGFTGNTMNPFPGYGGATTSYMGGIPYPMFRASGGRIPRHRRFTETVGAIRQALRGGGAVHGYADGGGVPPYTPAEAIDVAERAAFDTKRRMSRGDVLRTLGGLDREGRRRAREAGGYGYADGGVIETERDPSGTFVPSFADTFSPFARPPDATPANRELALGMADRYAPEGGIEMYAGAPMPRPRPDDLGQPPGLPPIMTTGMNDPDLPPDATAFAAPSPYSAPGPAAPMPFAAPPPAPAPSGGGLFGNLSDEARMGLISAGLGMAASKSPFFLSAVGEGGLAGVKQYSDAKARKDRIDSEARRLAQSASQFAQNLGLHRDQLAETARQHRETLAETRRHREVQESLANKPQLTVTGRDEYGNPKYGIFDPRTQTVKDVPKPSATDPTTGITITKQATTDLPLEPPKPPPAQITDESALPSELGDVGKGDEAVLTGLPDRDQRMVKAIVEGRQPIPSARELRTPYWQRMVELANQYDPNFDMSRWQARVQTRKNFATGVEGRIVRSMNTVANHLNELDEAGKAIKNWSSDSAWLATGALNRIDKWARENRGDPKLKTFETAATAVATELEKAFRGNQTAISGIKDWREKIKAEASPEEKAAANKMLAKLLLGQLEGLAGQYKAGMGVNADALTILQPQARKTFERLLGTTLSEHGDETKPASAPKAAGAPTRPASIPPSSQYSPSRKMWRTPDGKIYDAEGNPVP